jgi:murein DD-endopeptidase MepM/ murein hydrolase activator NlpD
LEFAASDLPYQPFHTGIDIATTNHQIGDPVGAFMAGTVTKVVTNRPTWGYGNYVVIDNGHHVSSLYAHLATISVEEQQQVEIGTVIGARGSTGWSTGPHLHFEVRVFGIPVNPRTFLVGNP